ncbi:MAG: hypothetical protein NTW14_02540 [bacterium]|nr:hypothetical protein [bacterium]
MRREILITICMGLLLAGFQNQTASAAVSVNLQLEASNNLEVFFLKDLNLSGSAPSAVVFRATLQSSSPEQVSFKFIMSSSQSVVAEGTSEVFPLSAGTHQYTNLDLSNSGLPCYLNDYDVNDEDANDIQTRLLETGYFPTDTYRMQLDVYSGANPDSLMATSSVSVHISNPFDIMLLSPNGTPGSPALVNNDTPLFSWSSSAQKFLIKICEKTSEGMDPESIMNGRPLYETEPSAPLMIQSFVYPGSGFRPLESGHTYYWQVTSLVETSSGPTEYPSPIGAFTIYAQINPQAQRILESLQKILGADFEPILSNLSGYQPSGMIRLDGRDVSISDLEAMVGKFSSQEYRTKAVNTE